MRLTFNELQNIFLKVKINFKWVSDEENHKEFDYWHSLIKEIELGKLAIGDCEDFAITCLELLYKNNADLKDLRLLTCWIPTIGYHAVAGYDDKDTTYIFDNNQVKVVKFSDLNYTWHLSYRLDEKVWRYV